MAGDEKKVDKRSQRQRFIDKARELGTDEDEAAFRDKLRRIAKANVTDKGTPPQAPRGRQKQR